MQRKRGTSHVGLCCTHFSLHVHRDTQKQGQIKAHFKDVIPVVSFGHRLKNESKRVVKVNIYIQQYVV